MCPAFNRYEAKLKGEAKVLAQLSHCNVTTFHGVVWEPGQYGIVMECVQHGSLDVFMGRYKHGLQLGWKLKAIGDIINGMIYLHSRKLIHRDLKSQNLLVSVELDIKVSSAV